MFLYVLTVLLVLNAFTQDAVLAEECRDTAPGATVCANMKKYNGCTDPSLKDMSEKYCRKTCGKC